MKGRPKNDKNSKRELTKAEIIGEYRSDCQANRDLRGEDLRGTGIHAALCPNVEKSLLSGAIRPELQAEPELHPAIKAVVWITLCAVSWALVYALFAGGIWLAHHWGLGRP